MIDKRVEEGTGPSPTPLSDLPAGARATLSGDRLEATDRELLRAMGVGSDAPVRVCRQGEPCIVEVRSTRVGLSRAIAALLHTVPAEPLQRPARRTQLPPG